MVRILIADDHPVVRSGLRNILTSGIEQAVCGEAIDSRQVLDQLETRIWDLVILDISMPGSSGLETLKEIKRRHPKLPVLVLSIHPEAQYGRRTLMAGASGYINKAGAPDDLVRAVKLVLAGHPYVSQAVADDLVTRFKDLTDRPPHERLSDREFEILQLIGSGKTTSQIAAKLRLRPATISTYRARLLVKMNMKTTAQLMHYALSNNLVD